MLLETQQNFEADASQKNLSVFNPLFLGILPQCDSWGQNPAGTKTWKLHLLLLLQEEDERQE